MMKEISDIEYKNMLQKPEQSLKNAYNYCHSISWRVLLLGFCTLLLHAKIVAASVEVAAIKDAATMPSTELKTNNDVLRRRMEVAIGRAVTILCKTSKRSDTYFYDEAKKKRLEPLAIENEILRPFALLVLNNFSYESTYFCYRNETLLSETILKIDRRLSSNVRIEIGEGDDAAFTCKHEEDQQVYFENGPKNTDIVSIDNRTSILLIRNSSLQFTKLECKYLNFSIDESELHVGTPPLPIENFTCVIQNYQSMTCEFPVARNFISPTYNLTYFGPFNHARNDCKLKFHKGKQILVMNISESSSCSYTPVNDFNFSLFAQNVLGNYSRKFSVNSDECVIPPKLQINTADNVTFHWDDVQKWHYTKGLIYDIRVKPNNLTEYSVPSPCPTLNCSLKLNLTYANWDYVLTIKARVNTNASKWNEPTVVNIKTASRIPDRPPDTIIGGYYINYNSFPKAISLYWEALAPYKQNGPGFYYSVKELKPNGDTKNTTETAVTFPFNNSGVYEVRAVNVNGSSVAASRIQVNVTKAKIKPRRIEQILDSANHTLTLKWKAPSEHSPISYTVLWCVAELVSLTTCKGSVHFKIIGNNNTEYRLVSKERSLIMAVAANYPDWSTGLYWNSCISELDGSLETLKPEVTFATSHSINIKWHLKICTDVFEGYNITYCNVTDERQNNCISESKSEIKNNSEIQSYILGDLSPYTLYRITMFMYDKLNRQSQPSEYIFIRTEEAAPEHPRNMHYEKLSSNSVYIFWDAPKITNGKLRKYTISYKVSANNKDRPSVVDIPVANLNNPNGMNISYKLQNLISYTEYLVWVSAWTKEQSQNSTVLNITTLMGRPSPPRDVKLNIIGDKYTFNWRDPAIPSGPVQIYQLKFIEGNKTKVTYIKRNSTSEDHQCLLHFADCTGTQILEVRAINEMQEDQLDRDAFPSNNTESKEKYEVLMNIECDDHITMQTQVPNGFKWLLSGSSSSDSHTCHAFPWQMLVASFIFVCFFCGSGFKTYILYRKNSKIFVKFPPSLEEMINSSSSTIESQLENKRDNVPSERYNNESTAEKLKESTNLLEYGEGITPSSSEIVSRSSSCEEMEDRYQYPLRDQLRTSDSANKLNGTTMEHNSVAKRNDDYAPFKQLRNNCNSNTISDSSNMILHSTAPRRLIDAVSAANDEPSPSKGPPAYVPPKDATTPASTANTTIGNYLPRYVFQAKNMQTQPNLFPKSAFSTHEYVPTDALSKNVAPAHNASGTAVNEEIQKPQQQKMPTVPHGYVTPKFWSLQ